MNWRALFREGGPGKTLQWACMRKLHIPNFDTPEVDYLTRYRIVQTPWFGVYLHEFRTPDSRPVLHDHPWTFLSIILRGSYVEMRRDNNTGHAHRRTRRWINLMRRDDAHYIISLSRVPTWSLMIVGKRRRTWGYWEPSNGPGTAVWTPFDKHRFATEYDHAVQTRQR